MKDSMRVCRLSVDSQSCFLKNALLFWMFCKHAKRILADEEEHEQDLQDLLRDVEWIVKAMEAKC